MSDAIMAVLKAEKEKVLPANKQTNSNFIDIDISFYFTEIFLGSVPKVGSCSGDCNLLAINLVSNKFIR